MYKLHPAWKMNEEGKKKLMEKEKRMDATSTENLV